MTSEIIGEIIATLILVTAVLAFKYSKVKSDK
jgi:hypothetical protein